MSGCNNAHCAALWLISVYYKWSHDEIISPSAKILECPYLNYFTFVVAVVHKLLYSCLINLRFIYLLKEQFKICCAFCCTIIWLVKQPCVLLGDSLTAELLKGSRDLLQLQILCLFTFFTLRLRKRQKKLQFFFCYVPVTY